MIINGVYITSPELIPQKPLIEVVQEFCQEIEPKPIYCEIPEDLKLKSSNNSGTTQTITVTTSMTSPASGYGTLTTTTTP